MSFEDIILPPHGNPIVIEWLKSGKAKIDAGSGCWLWQCAKNSTGYGQVRFQEKWSQAHRIAINSPIRMFALHSCRNRHCVNPFHLRAGTPHENMLDKKKERTGLKHGIMPRCACGKACYAKGVADCYDCMASRLNKPLCECGLARIYCKGLCTCCYRRYMIKTKIESEVKE